MLFSWSGLIYILDSIVEGLSLEAEVIDAIVVVLN